MNIAITFRHLDASEPVKEYAHDKVAKLQKFLKQPMRAKATLSLENKKQACEVEHWQSTVALLKRSGPGATTMTVS